MSEESEWENSKTRVDEILDRCMKLWLDPEADVQEKGRQIRLGLAIASRYLRLLRMDEDVRLAVQNRELIEQSQLQIQELERKLKVGEQNESKETS